jgi:hypothetical protein
MSITIEGGAFTNIRLLRRDVRPDGGAIFKCTVDLKDEEKIRRPETCFILCTPRVLPDDSGRDNKPSTFSAGMAVQSVTNSQIVIWFRRTDQIEWSNSPPLALSLLVAE